MNTRQDLPLKNDIAARFVPKIVASMVYLGTLCFAFALFVLHSTYSWEKQLTTDLSIEIPSFSEIPSASIQKRVVQLLNKTPGIQQTSVVSQKDLSELFHSLLGKDVDVDQFSLPIIIDVTLDKTEKVDIHRLDLLLKSVSPSIQLIDHQKWQGQVSNLIHTSLLIAVLIAFLVMSVALMTTIFATRTSLLIHRQVVEVLNLIGATNVYIAKQFQINAFKQGLIASAIGSFLAFLTFLGGVTLLEKAGFALSVQSSFFLQSVFIFGLTPFITAILMMISAHFAVMKALHR